MEVSSYVKMTWKPLHLKMRYAPHYEFGQQKVFSAEIIIELSNAEAEKKLFKHY